MQLEHNQASVDQEAIQRIEAQMYQAQQELTAGHQKEAQELLWKALGSASDLKDHTMATKILELLTKDSPQH